jgi:hypothetical protein
LLPTLSAERELPVGRPLAREDNHGVVGCATAADAASPRPNIHLFAHPDCAKNESSYQPIGSEGQVSNHGVLPSSGDSLQPLRECVAKQLRAEGRSN